MSFKISLSKKIAFALVINLLFMMVIIGLTLKSYNEIVSSYEQVNKDALKLIETGNERFGASQLIDFVNDYIITGKRDYISRFYLKYRLIISQEQKLRKLFTLKQDLAALDSIANNADSIYTYGRRIFNIPNPKASSKIPVLMERMDNKFEEVINRNTTQIFELISRRIESLRVQTMNRKNLILEVNSAMFLLSLFASLIFVLLTVYRISKPIKALVKSANKIAEGDYTERVQVTTHDEVALLAKSFSKMAEEVEKSYQGLETRRKFYNNIYASLPYALLVMDNLNKVLSVNKSFCNLFNLQCNQIIGSPVDNVLKKIELSDELRKKINERKLFQKLECICTPSENKNHKIHLILSSMFSTDTEEDVLLVIEDITEQKNALSLKEEFSAQNTALFETIMDGFWLLDSKGQFLDVNNNYCNMSGFTKEEMLKLSVPDVEAYETPEITEQHIRKVIANGADRFETKHKRKDGTIWDVEISTVFLSSQQQFIVFARDISERKRMLTELKLKESAINSAINAVVMTDSYGVLNYVNRSFLKMWGYNSDAETLGRSAVEFVEDTGKARNIIAHLTKHGSWIGELTALKKNGIKFPVRITASVIKDEEGNIIRMYASFMDMTEHKHYEKEILKLSQAVEQNPVSILITDADGNIEYVNKKFVQMTGFTLKEVINKNPRILQSGFTSRKLYDDLWEAISQGRIWQGEFQNKKKDGSYYWHLMILSPLRDGEGRIVNYLAVQQDITERKVLEGELKKYREHLEELVEKRTNELRVSEEKFRTLAESSDDTIMRFDKESKHLYVNPVVVKQTGIPSNDFIGKTHRELGFPENLVQLWETTIQNVFASKEKNRIEFQLPNNIWIDWILLPVFNEKNEVDSVITSGRDITSLKEYEKRIEEAFKKEKELSELKSKFISAASHEFRTPLAAILSSAQLIKRYSTKWKDDEINEHHKVINDSVKNITALMDDVLLISKSEEGKIKLQIEDVNIEEFLNSLIIGVKPLLKSEQKINYKIATGLKSIKMDRKIVSQIIGNLLSNAIKYSSAGSKVELLSDIQDNKLLVRVKDTGIGIAKEELQLIFDPFYRTQNAIHIEGTGLGLNIVKRMLDVLNGTIEVDSEIGKGTTFDVSIPLFDNITVL